VTYVCDIRIAAPFARGWHEAERWWSATAEMAGDRQNSGSKKPSEPGNIPRAVQGTVPVVANGGSGTQPGPCLSVKKGKGFIRHFAFATSISG
jgi:hypothetical protein